MDQTKQGTSVFDAINRLEPGKLLSRDRRTSRDAGNGELIKDAKESLLRREIMKKFLFFHRMDNCGERRDSTTGMYLTGTRQRHTGLGCLLRLAGSFFISSETAKASMIQHVQPDNVTGNHVAKVNRECSSMLIFVFCCQLGFFVRRWTKPTLSDPDRNRTGTKHPLDQNRMPGVFPATNRTCDGDRRLGDSANRANRAEPDMW